MGVATIYTISVNIRWQLHSCDSNNLYNMTSINELIISENVYFNNPNSNNRNRK